MKTTIEDRIEKLEYTQTAMIVILFVMMAIIIALSWYVFFGPKNKGSSPNVSGMTYGIMIADTAPTLIDYKSLIYLL